MKQIPKHSVLLSDDEIRTLLDALECRISVNVSSESVAFQRVRSRLTSYLPKPSQVNESLIFEIV